MPNTQAHLLPEAGAERNEAEASGSQVQRLVRREWGRDTRFTHCPTAPVSPRMLSPVC